MITAVDTNVLIDVFSADPQHGPRSREALRQCQREGGLIACEVVWAEVASGFDSGLRAAEQLEALGVAFSPLGPADAIAAGDAHRSYRRAGGERGRVVADFLIGAHAAAHADRLLTRDRGFYRSRFAGLQIVDPSAS